MSRVRLSLTSSSQFVNPINWINKLGGGCVESSLLGRTSFLLPICKFNKLNLQIGRRKDVLENGR